MLGTEGGRKVGGQGVEAGGELLHPLLQGQHLALQVLAAIVELRHELIHDALHLQEAGGHEERRGDDSVYTECFEEGRRIANTENSVMTAALLKHF